MAVRLFEPGGAYQRMLYDRSDGRIKLNIIGRAFPAEEVLIAVGRGKVDMGVAATPHMAGTYPLWSWDSVPGTLSSDPIDGVLEGLKVYQDPRLLELYDRTFREAGCVYLLPNQWGESGALWSNKPITTVADMEGLKLRVSGRTVVAAAEALGAVPITVAEAEQQSAMVSGVVDAIITGAMYGYQIGNADIAKYVTPSPILPGYTASVVMNAELFDSLPADIRAIIREVSMEMAEMNASAIIAELLMTEVMLDTDPNIELLHFEEGEEELFTQRVVISLQLWLEDAGPDGAELIKILEENRAEYRAFKIQ